MSAFFLSLQFWHWLILAMVLFGLEMLGAGGFLLGAGAAAILLALVTGFAPSLEWSYQLLLYGLLAITLTVWYWYRFSRFNVQTDEPQLNNRAAQMVGEVIDLPDGLAHGRGRVQVGDTFWQLRADVTIVSGRQVKVVATQGMILLVELRQ
jgi:membrane protein implicated in regulation of membrane protease activity